MRSPSTAARSSLKTTPAACSFHPKAGEKCCWSKGHPGFEHTFVKRSLARDTALEVDSVVRKGKNDEGRDTFFIQAVSSRTNALATGYRREERTSSNTMPSSSAMSAAIFSAAINWR